MKEQVAGEVIFWLLGAGGGAWALFQLWRAIWGSKADQKDMDSLNRKVEEIKTDVHKLRGIAVTREDLANRKLEVDKLLEDRRQDVIALHEKIDGTETGFREEMRGLRDSIDTKLDRITNMLLQARQ